jgi:tetratricopeptide (TPR) repeat protein
MSGGLVLLALLALRPQAAGAAATAEQAERLAQEAMLMAPRDAAGALKRARQALDLTAEFQPTAFVTAGRKGEVVEDAFQAARSAYRRHRAVLYEAAGTALARLGEPVAASRYLGRAFLLDPTPDRGVALARNQIDLGMGREALATIQKAIGGLVGLKPEVAEVIARAADVAGLPSAQAEIDRGRLVATLGNAVTLREGPLELPPGVRLSTDPVFRIDQAKVTLIYAAEESCRSCSADLEAIARQVPPGVRVLALPPGDDRDQALRQVLALYRRPWPLLLGRDLGARLGLAPRSVLLIAREGWTLAVLKAPFGVELNTALTSLARQDVPETVPLPSWNHRPVDRRPLPPAPPLLAEGIAPGEDEPAPPEFARAVSSFRAGRYAEALGLFEKLEARGDGWLLSPESRIDRALCLAGMGQRDAARRILLRTGDSRFEEATDVLLEKVAGN